MRKRFAGLLFISLFCTSLSILSAATYFWDADATTPFNQNGSGVWNSSSLQWTNSVSDSSSPSLVAWENASHHATIGSLTGYTNSATGGTITLEENISLAVLEKSTAAGVYTIEGNGHSFTFNSSDSRIGNNALSAALVINAVIEGTQGISKTMNGTVVFAQNNLYSGGTIIRTSNISATDKSSVLQIGNGGTSGSLGSGNVTFASAGVASAQSVLAFHRSDVVILTQDLISDATNPNKGILRQAGSGTLQVNSENTDFTGSIEVTQGTLVVGNGATSGALEGATQASIATNTTLAFDRTDQQTFSAQVSGAGTLEKRNTGTLLLSGTGSSHTGALSVTNGTVKILNAHAASTSSTLRLSDGSVFDVDTFEQRFANLIVENNASAKVIGTGSLVLGAQNTVVGANQLNQTSTLDLRELAEFRFEGGTTYNFRVGGNISSNDNVATVTGGNLYLATRNVISASLIGIGSVNGGGSSPKNEGYLYLGRENIFTTSSLMIGSGVKNQAGVSFAADVQNGTLTLRGTNASQRATVTIGQHESGFVTVNESYLDTTAGSIDARIGTLLIGNNPNSLQPAKGRFSMGAGTLDVTTITLGQRASTSEANTTALFELNGGSVKVENVIMANHTGTGAGGGILSTFRLLSGNLAAKSIVAGTDTSKGTRKLEWTAGTITHYDASSNLDSSNVAFHLKGSGTREFVAGTNRSITIQGNFINETGNTTYQAFTKKGNGTLILSGTLATHAPNLTLEAGTLRLGSSERISNGGSIAFTGAATLDLQGYQETLADLRVTNGVSAVVIGTAGSALHIAASTENMTVGGTNMTSLDLSGISAFTYTNATRDIRWGGQGNTNTSQATIKLASNNNTIIAKNFGLSAIPAGATGGQNVTQLELGQNNTFHSDTFTLGGIKSKVTMGFANTVSNGSVVFRNTAGTDRANMSIGNNQSGAISSETTLDFSRGTVDALIDHLKLGANSNQIDQDKPSHATFIMSQGVVDATTLTLGAYNGSNTANIATPSNVGNGTFTLNGTGLLKARTINFAEKTNTGQGRSSGTLDLNQGTLRAETVRQLASSTFGTSTFLWRSGNIRNYDETTDSTFQNVNLTLEGASGARAFDVEANRKVVIHSSLINGSQTTTQGFTKLGSGSLELRGASTYTGTTTISEGRMLALNITGSATGGSSVNVAATGTLAGSGILKPTGSNGISIAGRLEVGDLSDTIASSLTFDLSDTTGSFNQSGILDITLFSNIGDNSNVATAADSVHLLNIGSSTVEFAGSLDLNLADAAMSFSEGDRWKIASLENNSSASIGTFSSITSQGFSLGPNLMWNVERDMHGIYAVVAVIPEPNRVAFLALGIVALFCRRNRQSGI